MALQCIIVAENTIDNINLLFIVFVLSLLLVQNWTDFVIYVTVLFKTNPRNTLILNCNCRCKERITNAIVSHVKRYMNLDCLVLAGILK